MGEKLEKRYFICPRRDISYLRFLLEAYDGLAFFRTLEPATGLVEVIYPGSRHRDAEDLLRALEKELQLRPCAPPAEELLPPI